MFVCLVLNTKEKDFTGGKKEWYACVASNHIFNGRDHSFSSSGLRSRVVEAETLKAIDKNPINIV
jgi:hypothetical protein